MKIAAIVLLLFGTALGKTYYPMVYRSLGCWKDKESRAIPPIEGKGWLHGNYRTRVNPTQKCAREAKKHGFSVFAVQHGVWCASSKYARTQYRKYGRTNRCSKNGEGGAWANEVYEITRHGAVSIKNLGCWADKRDRAIESLEDQDLVLDGGYIGRKDALEKCIAAAFARGIKVIGLQHGGRCAGSKKAGYSYKKYGPSSKCRSNGEGGPWANQVYQLYYH